MVGLDELFVLTTKKLVSEKLILSMTMVCEVSEAEENRVK